MKHTRILTTIGILVLAAALWHGFTNRSADQPKPAQPMHAESTGKQLGASDNTPLTYEERARRALAEMAAQDNVAIEFYGRVFDQDGHPLAGVAVDFKCQALPDNPVPWGPDKIVVGSASTGGEGRFSINGYRGQRLSFTLRKTGYRQCEASASFGPGNSAPHHPDPANPVEYILIRDDLPTAEQVGDIRLRFSWNQGQTTVDLGPEIGKLFLTPKRNGYDSSNKRRPYDWSVDMQASGFTMARLSDNSPRVAPADGYRQDHSYVFTRDKAGWSPWVANNFAIRTVNGHYGIMELRLYSDREDNGVSGGIDVYLNRSGARNIDRR